MLAIDDGTPMDGHVNDLYTFDVTSKSWQGLLPFENGMLPLQPRAETQAACYKGGAVYIFGGYTMRELSGYRYYDDGVRITDQKEGELRWTGIKPFDSSTSASAGAAGGGGRAAAASTANLHPSGRAGRCRCTSALTQPSTTPR